MSLLSRALSWVPVPLVKATARLQWRHPWLKRGFEWVAARVRSGGGVISHGVGRGLAIQAGRSNAGYVLGTSEPHVQRALELLLAPGMTVFDVGANVGFFTLIAARLVGPRGLVVSFEPLKANATLITQNTRANGFDHVSVREEALGAHDGVATMLISDVPSWGRLADLGAPPPHPAGEARVRLRRLDSLVTEGHVPPPDFVKLDVEGAETDVLQGGTTILTARHPVLLVELHGTNRPVADELDRLGYRSVVLGSTASVSEARWDAHLVAYAPNDTRVASLAGALSDPSIARQ